MAAVNLHLDLETYSELDLAERGLDNYADHPSTEILMLAWAVNEALPEVWFPGDGPIPDHLRLMIERPEIRKWAFNAEFERVILRKVAKVDTPINAWRDPMIMGRNASIAGDLEFVGSVMDIPKDQAKMKEGRELIRLFCMPRKKGRATRETHPEKWATFVQYCKNDVIAERYLSKKLKMFTLREQEQKLYELDQLINERGMPVDLDFVAKATKIVADEHRDLMEQARAATGCKNPGSRDQMLAYLKTQAYPYGSLGAHWVKKALAENDVTEAGRTALELRKKLAKSSTSKLDTLAKFICADGRLRRQYVFYGAPRTGRWAGRAVQLQNLPRPTIEDIPGAVVAILSGDRETVRKFGPPLEVVASCLRSAFRVQPGKKFVACDLGSIETRGTGWVADCDSILGVFKKGLDAYIDFGTRMYHLPYDALDPGVPGLSAQEKSDRKDKRQICKPAVLGCGYGLGGGDIGYDKNDDEIKTGLWGYAENMSVEMTREQSHESVHVYRENYPEVCAAWRKLEKAAILACQTGLPHTCCHMVFQAKPGKLLQIVLPNGRALNYIRPSLELKGEWNGEPQYKLRYEGVPTGYHGVWGSIATWGGKIMENVVQALSRDILAESMLRAHEKGFTIVGHCHDEIICEEDVNGSLGLKELRECMIEILSWAPDLPLGADGYQDEVYHK